MLRAIGALALAGLALAIVVPAGSSSASRAPRPSHTLTIGGPATGQAIPPGFLGLSFEYFAVPQYAGANPRHVNPVFLQLIRNLAGDSAPVLRIGGISTDNIWWPIRGASPPAGVTFGLTRPWIATIGAVAAKLDARLILGINLEADSPAVAAAEARALVTGVGRRHVEALELGNEPELYGVFGWGFSGHPGRPSNWDFTAFNRDFAHIAGALPNLPLAGPTVGQPNWFGYMNRFLSTQPRVVVATLHRYPLQRCFLGPEQIKYPSIAHLLAPAASRGLANSVAEAVRTAHAHHVALRIDEMNSVSCGQHYVPGVTHTFASALWTVDALFEMARVEVDGVNIHSYPTATYSPFAFQRVRGRWRAAIAPDYYGLAMFARAAPAGSRLLRVSPAGIGKLNAWATRAPDGTIHVVVINEGSKAQNLRVRLAGATITGTLERLEAPSITARGRVTLAGQTFGAATGLPVGAPQTTSVAPTRDGYEFRVPGASAAMLTIA